MNNRPIKFRVWDGQKFLYSYAENGESFKYEDKYIGIDWFIQCERLENPTRFWVQQFTSLLDKFGREIYEGDICKWKWAAGEGQIEESTGEVFFENGIFYFGREYFCTADVNFDELSLEVIGNIFELTA